MRMGIGQMREINETNEATSGEKSRQIKNAQRAMAKREEKRLKMIAMDESTERQLIDEGASPIKRGGKRKSQKNKGKLSMRMFGATGGPQEHDDDEESSSYSDRSGHEESKDDDPRDENETFDSYQAKHKADAMAITIEEQEAQARKRLFISTIRTKNWKFVALNTFAGFVFTFYFLFTYIYHISEVKTLTDIKNYTPLLFQRYTDNMLTYSFMRERIINNNDVSSFYNPKLPLISPHSIDNFYKERALRTEGQIANLKLQTSKSGLNYYIDFLKMTDSENFCDTIFDPVDVSAVLKEFGVVANNKQSDLRERAYFQQLQTTIPACHFASQGNLEQLKLL